MGLVRGENADKMVVVDNLLVLGHFKNNAVQRPIGRPCGRECRLRAMLRVVDGVRQEIDGQQCGREDLCGRADGGDAAGLVKRVAVFMGDRRG